MKASYPAISLWQPFASLLFVPGGKVHETRHWPAPKRLITRTVAIHAAKTDKGIKDMSPSLSELTYRLFPPATRPLPRGELIGTATLTCSFQIGTQWFDQGGPVSDEDELCGDWTSGRYAWRLDNRVAFPEPIPTRGQQGWWTVEIDIEEAVKMVAS